MCLLHQSARNKAPGGVTLTQTTRNSTPANFKPEQFQTTSRPTRPAR